MPTVQKHTEQLVHTFEQFIRGLSLMEMTGRSIPREQAEEKSQHLKVKKHNIQFFFYFTVAHLMEKVKIEWV